MVILVNSLKLMTIGITNISLKILKITPRKCKNDLQDHNQKRRVVKFQKLQLLDLYPILFKIKESSSGQELVLESRKPIDFKSLLKNLLEMFKLHRSDSLVKSLVQRVIIISLKQASKVEMKK